MKILLGGRQMLARLDCQRQYAGDEALARREAAMLHRSKQCCTIFNVEFFIISFKG
jgi:hypothetical protein